MRKHPKMQSFYSLALQIIQERKESFIGILGEDRYRKLILNFRQNLDYIQREAARSERKEVARWFGLRKPWGAWS